MAQTGEGYGVAASTSGISLSDLKTICYYHGWSDSTPTGAAQLTNFINDSLEILCTLAPWPEYCQRDGSATFAIADDDVALDETKIIRIGSVVRDDRVAPLDEYPDGVDGWLLDKKYHAGSGPPTRYALRKYVSSGDILIEMLVYPKPAAEIILYYTYQNGPTTLDQDSDTSDWPTVRKWLLIKALQTRLATVDRDTTGAVLYGAEFMQYVNRAFNHSRPSYRPIVADAPVIGTWKTPLSRIEKTIVS